jgi:hypothetical protein
MKKSSLLKFATALCLSAQFAFADSATQWTSTSDLKAAAGKIIGIMVVVGFVASLVLWYAGTAQKEQDPGAAAKCFKAAWMSAIGPLVIGLIYAVVGLSAAVATPTF